MGANGSDSQRIRRQKLGWWTVGTDHVVFAAARGCEIRVIDSSWRASDSRGQNWT